MQNLQSKQFIMRSIEIGEVVHINAEDSSYLGQAKG
jgi:hypothetical protein